MAGGKRRERASDVRASLLGDCEWEQLEVREQGRTSWAKANTLHHGEQGKPPYNTSKLCHCMPSHISTPQ